MAGRRVTDKLRAEWFWADRWTTSRGHTLPVGPRGVYREMLTQAWLREAKLPNDPEEICRICAFTKKEWNACWPAVQPFWIVEEGSLVNVTQVVVYLEAKEAAAKNTTRAQAGAQAMHERRRSKAVSSAQALPSVSVSEPFSGKNPEKEAPLPTARSGRPIFSGTKLVVFEWQFTNCVNDLGGPDAAAAFGLDEWFHELNAQCERDRVLPPKRDGGAWLQQQLIQAANRRGIPLRIAAVAEAGKLTTRLASAVASIHAEAK